MNFELSFFTSHNTKGPKNPVRIPNKWHSMASVRSSSEGSCATGNGGWNGGSGGSVGGPCPGTTRADSASGAGGVGEVSGSRLFGMAVRTGGVDEAHEIGANLG